MANDESLRDNPTLLAVFEAKKLQLLLASESTHIRPILEKLSKLEVSTLDVVVAAVLSMIRRYEANTALARATTELEQQTYSQQVKENAQMRTELIQNLNAIAGLDAFTVSTLLRQFKVLL